MVRKIGIRKLIRQGFGRRIIEKVSHHELVKASTYRDYERRIEEYARRRQRPKQLCESRLFSKLKLQR
jgi:hypothetical protein